jgi:hypothetical protein
MGFIQNVVQCESAIQTNKRKRKTEEDFDYPYGIITSVVSGIFTVLLRRDLKSNLY